jgi:hypothetical protein
MPSNIRQQGHWVSTGNPETVDDTNPYAPGMLGSKVTVKTPGPGGTPSTEQYRDKTFMYVQGDSTMSVAPFRGAVMWWADKTRYRVTTSPTTLGRGRVAGIYKKVGGPTSKGNFFFIQTEGPSIVKMVDAPTSPVDATGKFIVPSTTPGKADCIVTAPTTPILGYSAGTYDAAAAEYIVDLDVPSTP